MNKLLTGIALILLVVQHTSCKVGKKPTRRKVIVDSTAIARVQDSIKAEELNNSKKLLIEKLTPLWKQGTRFNTFNAKVKVHYQGPDDRKEFTANIRIEKDKAIWASVTALGMVNVARIYITPDSFKLINYLENKATLMSLKDADTMLPVPVDFRVLQNMLIGDVLKQSGQITDANEFGGSWSLQTEDEDFVLQYTYNKGDSTIRSAQLSSKKDAGTKGMIQLGNYIMVTGRKFSSGRAINMMNKGQSHYLDMDFNRVDFDEPVDFPFNIPRKFEVNGVVVDDDKPEPRRQRRRDR